MTSFGHHPQIMYVQRNVFLFYEAKHWYDSSFIGRGEVELNKVLGIVTKYTSHISDNLKTDTVLV